MASKNDVASSFRKKGYRATPQRIVIAQTVLKSKEHPTAEQVYDEVKREYPTISLSTVYNTLHILRDMNMVNELAFNDSIRFDPNTRIHINMVCENCGRIIDLLDNELLDIVVRISDKEGFSISGHRLDVYGKCRQCSR